MSTAPPPIRIVTRLLARMQTSIISEGLSFASGNLDRFAMLSLIVRQTVGPAEEPVRPMPVLSLANSLSAPYETVRRNVAALIAAGLCERHPGGVAVSAAGQAALTPYMMHVHAALGEFVAALHAAGVPLPSPRPAIPYSPVSGVRAAADIMLTVLDGNRAPHGSWLQLVVFSAVMDLGFATVTDDVELSRHYADEREVVPDAAIPPTRVATVARRLGMPETTVRRQLAAMVADGRVEREDVGYRVSQQWLNLPENIEVSRTSYMNIRRVMELLAAAGFPFP
ncbi:helix-turn-helix domain-containing protein [Sphingomonas sp. RS2018]